MINLQEEVQDFLVFEDDEDTAIRKERDFLEFIDSKIIELNPTSLDGYLDIVYSKLYEESFNNLIDSMTLKHKSIHYRTRKNR